MKKAYTSVVVFRDDDKCPIFSEGSTHISVDDDAAGAFIKINQHADRLMAGEIRLDDDEIDFVLSEAKKLIEEYNKSIQ